MQEILETREPHLLLTSNKNPPKRSSSREKGKECVRGKNHANLENIRKLAQIKVKRGSRGLDMRRQRRIYRFAETMAESRRQTRSTGTRRRGQSDAQFKSRQPDPLMIERGQSEAIQLVRDTVSTGNTTVPPMTYLDKDGLEEQFLTEDEVTQEIADVTANRVTTPVEVADTAPLDPIYTQRSQQEEELDLQPSRGPQSNSLLNIMEQFLDENYEDVLRTSNMQTDFSAITHNSAPCQKRTPLRWIVPDGTNHRLEDITDRKKADGTPGGGSSGSMVITLPRIEPYFGTQFFLVDIDTGELFALIQQQWRRTGLSCAEQPFLITQLMEKVERMG